MNVIHLVSNKEWGGGERYTLDLCKALRADGHQVQIFARNIKAVREPFEHAGIPVTTMRLGGVWDVLSPVRLSSRLSRIDGPIVVHVHNFKDAYTAIAARRMARNSADIRIVATRHLVKKAGTDPHHLRIYDGLDAIIFVSRLAYEEFLSSRPQVNRSKLHVVLNSLALEPYDRRDKRSGDPSVNLIFAGRITPEKGLEELVRALGTLKDLDWQLEVCGTGRGRDVMPVVALSTLLGIDDRIVWMRILHRRARTHGTRRHRRVPLGVARAIWPHHSRGFQPLSACDNHRQRRPARDYRRGRDGAARAARRPRRTGLGAALAHNRPRPAPSHRRQCRQGLSLGFFVQQVL